MGQAMRIVSYDRAANERNAIPSLKLYDQNLSWFRLDDGVMGGQSETIHSDKDGQLAFEGTINTNGGGFCSIRTKLSEGLLPTNTKSIRLKFIGDGKTYKLLLSDGSKSTFGPSRKSPSWQADIPTHDNRETEKEEILEIPITSLKPSWVFGPSEEEQKMAKFDVSAMQELGLMLSLKLSDGSPNPVETFGQGTFPFSLKVSSIEAVPSSSTPPPKSEQ
eukprot:CAMPEP_0178752174 /NCGR_PEP_ID=MMETSP0744-20121128/10919_1 /TAXON_ID=913974 /ORGANISM="Nitzschia punctata, Strain CCMP561" /LENGTH=218 /DNA_ID=CAMNT_0020405869 /DNA_START=35 /DNA_END=691 /DNA_ORIENTATION=-